MAGQEITARGHVDCVFKLNVELLTILKVLDFSLARLLINMTTLTLHANRSYGGVRIQQ
jgi:hypothetical protein